MMSAGRKIAALLCIASVLAVDSFAVPVPLDADSVKLNFDVVVSPGDLAEAPEARAPSPAFARGDFSSVPPYNFAYLNDINTKLIDLAGRSVDIAIFSITLKDNPEALIRAKSRGVRVRLLLDEKHVYPKADSQINKLIKDGGIEIRTIRGTRAYGVNHNKIGIFDNSAVATGSYNWTFGATFSNHENTMVAQHPTYVNGYVKYFDWMWSKARTLSQGPAGELPEGYYGAPPQDQAPVMRLNGVKVPAFLFSPGSGSEERLAELLAASRKSVDVVTFSFSSKILADALIEAKNRGVKVRFLMDTNMAKTSGLAKLVFSAGVPFRWGIGRTDKGALHDKFAILDGQVLETGSFNWTSNASRHSFENMIFTNDAEAIKAYQYIFDWLYSHAETPSEPDFGAED
jgi:phospholipase D